MRRRATVTTTMMNVPKGVARSIALSHISVAFVELVGVTEVVDGEGGSEMRKMHHGRHFLKLKRSSHSLPKGHFLTKQRSGE